MDKIIEQINKNNFRFFRAKVVDIQDPKKLGRVKVWIPDIMYDYDDNDGLWALPANNVFGGNNDQQGYEKYSGSSLVPRQGDWVWVFFENDNINRPYYITGINLEDQPRIPESQTGQEYWNKWTIFRSPEGRAIWISDDNSTPDARVMITGKKQDKENTGIFKIIDNQSSIMIQEDKTNRILLADYHKNYLSINTDANTIYTYASSRNNLKGKINEFTDKTLIRQYDDNADGTVIVQNKKCVIVISGSNITISSLQGNVTINAPNASIDISSNSIKLHNSQSLININQGKVDIFASEMITLQAPTVNINPGQSYSPSPKPTESIKQIEEDQIP